MPPSVRKPLSTPRKRTLSGGGLGVFVGEFWGVLGNFWGVTGVLWGIFGSFGDFLGVGLGLSLWFWGLGEYLGEIWGLDRV